MRLEATCHGRTGAGSEEVATSHRRAWAWGVTDLWVVGPFLSEELVLL